MSKDFNLEELKKLIKIKGDGNDCGIDEVLMLLAEYIGDEEVLNEVGKYVDNFYDSINSSFEYTERLDRKIEDAVKKLTEAEVILRS